MPTRRTRRRAKDSMDEALEMAVATAIGATWNRLMGEGLDKYAEARRAGLGIAVIADLVRSHLASLSPAQEALQAREASTVAYGKGRNVALVEAAAKTNVEFAVRTNVLDESTCDACWDLDGHVVVIGSDEFFELDPPARCLGGERCRCEYVALAPEVMN